MLRVCFICGKKPSAGYAVSHSHRRTKRKWQPNLQTVKIIHQGKVKRVKVCAKCLKRGKITKAL